MGKSGMVEKTLRSVLACLMAIVLIAGLLPVMPREAAAEEEASIAANNSEDWQQFDECEWRIDDSGCLTIRPTNGVTGKKGLPTSMIVQMHQGYGLGMMLEGQSAR